MSGITKRYGGVTALDNVEFQADRGSIHAVLGENGAGKSTLIKIISGVVKPDIGDMALEGKKVAFSGPLDATRHGIACVFQELSLLPDLSVADNICITDPPGRYGFIRQRQQRAQAEELLARVGCEDVNPRRHLGELPLSRRQMVEIAKALGRKPKLLILDEATSALTAADVEKVYAILRALREEGLCILYISHRMHEIEALADTCSVFRNGRHIETFAAGSKTHDQIVQLMIGREISHVFPPKPEANAVGEPVLDVHELSWADRLHKISMSVGKGEIVGLGGLDGQGQREFLLALFGVLRGVSGKVLLDGRPVHIGSPAEAKSARNRLALIPEDRKTEGLMLPMSIGDNMTIAALEQLTRHFVVKRSEERQRVDDMIRQLQIKLNDVADAVAGLSGGNQQKVVIAKWLMTDARVLLLMDPTRGIDVGTKQEIYRLLRRLADSGVSVVFYTTDYDELIGMCDRVHIFYDGRIIRTLEGEAITEHNIVATALNLTLGEGQSAAGGAAE